MFGSDIIRIKVKGYLRNITDNEIFEFEERGIKNKDKITFNNNDIKYSIRCNDNEIMMIRDGNDFVNTFIFNNNKKTYKKGNKFYINIKDLNELEIIKLSEFCKIKYC